MYVNQSAPKLKALRKTAKRLRQISFVEFREIFADGRSADDPSDPLIVAITEIDDVLTSALKRIRKLEKRWARLGDGLSQAKLRSRRRLAKIDG